MHVAVFAVLFSVVTHCADHHSQVHHGGQVHHSFNMTRVAETLVHNMDANHNGELTMAEIGAELGSYDLNRDRCVTQAEFTIQWIKEYHDTLSATHQFFNNLNSNKNQCLEMIDLTDKFSEMDAIDHNGVITLQEFEDFLLKRHPDSHLHPHGIIG